MYHGHMTTEEERLSGFKGFILTELTKKDASAKATHQTQLQTAKLNQLNILHIF
jgi:hypothetical protein